MRQWFMRVCTFHRILVSKINFQWNLCRPKCLTQFTDFDKCTKSKSKSKSIEIVDLMQATRTYDIEIRESETKTPSALNTLAFLHSHQYRVIKVKTKEKSGGRSWIGTILHTRPGKLLEIEIEYIYSHKLCVISISKSQRIILSNTTNSFLSENNCETKWIAFVDHPERYPFASCFWMRRTVYTSLR